MVVLFKSLWPTLGVSLFQEDDKLLTDILSLITDEATPPLKRRDLVLFLKEYCNFSQNLHPQGKEAFYKVSLQTFILHFYF